VRPSFPPTLSLPLPPFRPWSSFASLPPGRKNPCRRSTPRYVHPLSLPPSLPPSLPFLFLVLLPPSRFLHHVELTESIKETRRYALSAPSFLVHHLPLLAHYLPHSLPPPFPPSLPPSGQVCPHPRLQLERAQGPGTGPHGHQGRQERRRSRAGDR